MILMIWMKIDFYMKDILNLIYFMKKIYFIKIKMFIKIFLKIYF